MSSWFPFPAVAAFEWQPFFDDLFARQAFTSRLLERSFHTTAGLMELGLCVLIFAATLWLARRLERRWQNRDDSRRFMLQHIVLRMIWPTLLLLASVSALLLWQQAGYSALWLQLLAMAARWMMLIRLCLAVLRSIIPDHRLSCQIERSLSMLLWVAFVLWVSGVDDLLLEALQRVVIPLGSKGISLYAVLTGLLSVCVVVVAALWLAQLLENRLMQMGSVDINVRLVLSKILKTLMVALAVILALPMVGIDLTVLSVFGGALGVGLGFGLQKIASNYISGFIILSDRSIRLGDRLKTGDFTGYVTKITSRFVVLRSGSGVEALIPNDNFITSTVINESYTSKSLWTSLDVQVAYATDLPQAMAILQEAAAAQERVAAEPPPKAYVTAFADSGINLRVGFWVNDPENGFLGLQSEILLAIWREFNAAGIEFPFPQREIRILNEPETPVQDSADATRV
ncbi:small-conductance mechanosensitive channel [Neisseria sp. HSC-16F19]|nr:mechanosensitive ion channel domain-containing protein [Neisseria sp. HSC-16F19]MCP2041729.1 small-conductance mechanosensitive channel [Neisseria sp. HSC-16F19]